MDTRIERNTADKLSASMRPNPTRFRPTRSRPTRFRSVWARSITVTGLCAVLLMSLGGCRLCCNSEDMAYPTYGGAWQRTVRDSGRVGSIFDPAGARSSTLVSRESTEPIDEQQRRLRGPSEKKDRPDDMFEEEREAEKNAEELPSPRQSLEGESGFGDDVDPKLEAEKSKLRKETFESIKVIEGDPLPPQLR